MHAWIIKLLKSEVSVMIHNSFFLNKITDNWVMWLKYNQYNWWFFFKKKKNKKKEKEENGCLLYISCMLVETLGA